MPRRVRTAEIVVAAAGRPNMVRGDWIRPGATVIDVGQNAIAAPEKGEGKTRLVGDVAFEEARRVAGAITPVPGGVGPMTIALLMANTLTAAFRAAGLELADVSGALAMAWRGPGRLGPASVPESTSEAVAGGPRRLPNSVRAAFESRRYSLAIILQNWTTS